MRFSLSQSKKKLRLEGYNFLKKHNIKLPSHENVFIVFENLDITGTPTLFGWMTEWDGKNDWIDKILTLGSLVMWINCIELPPRLNQFVIICRTL